MLMWPLRQRGLYIMLMWPRHQRGALHVLYMTPCLRNALCVYVTPCVREDLYVEMTPASEKLSMLMWPLPQRDSVLIWPPVSERLAIFTSEQSCVFHIHVHWSTCLYLGQIDSHFMNQNFSNKSLHFTHGYTWCVYIVHCRLHLYNSMQAHRLSNGLHISYLSSWTKRWLTLLSAVSHKITY